MKTATVYKTKQRETVENCLKNNKNRHLTADEITEILRSAGQDVGRTTVYRTLEKLIQEGRVRRYAAAKGDSACYQYLTDTACHEHFHLKCTGCGKLLHIECEQMQKLNSHILSEHKFRVDKLQTVLYGLCEKCAERQSI